MKNKLNNIPVSVLPPNIQTTFFATKELFNLHFFNWISGGATIPTSTISTKFFTRRLHDAGVHWAAVETANDTLVWTLLDNELTAAEFLGAKCYYLFGFGAAWQSSQPASPGVYSIGDKYPVAVMANWTDFVTRVIQRYQNRLWAVEGWNEANLTNFWGGTPAEVITQHNAMYDAVKAVNSTIPVISPAPTGLTGSGLPSQPEYIKSLVDGGCKFDLIGMHAYPNTAISFAQQCSNLQKFFEAAVGLRKLYNKSVIITEAGHQNWAGLSELEKESYVKRSMFLAAAYGIPWTFYGYDNPATGDISATSRQAWWNLMITTLVDKYVTFIGMDTTGVMSGTINGTAFSI